MEAKTPEREFDLITGEHEAAVPDRNVAMELVRVTEYGALAAARWIGKGEKNAADKAAVDAMRLALHNVSMDGVIVIGEGEKDEAPMLYNGEHIGDGSPPQVDIAVDPLEGTELTAMGFPSALSVIALSERGTMFNPGPAVYMEKMATSPSLAHVLDMDKPLGEIVNAIAAEKGVDVGDVMVTMLDRPRHQEQVKEIRQAGARIRFIPHGDVSASLLAAQDGSPVDLLWGIGGTPEGVISACAIKCIGGQILGRLWPRDEEEKQAIVDAGLELGEVLDRDRLVSGENVFFAATGVTEGDVLEGVRYLSSGAATTESLAMRSRSGTVRRIHARHDRAKLRRITGERIG
jgi:fructose-1,6-bisphosphatase II